MSARPHLGFLFGLASLKSGPRKTLYSSWSPYPSWCFSPLEINSPSQNQGFPEKDNYKVAEWEKNPSGWTWESVDSSHSVPWGRGSSEQRTLQLRNELPLSCGCGWLRSSTFLKDQRVSQHKVTAWECSKKESARLGPAPDHGQARGCRAPHLGVLS